MDESFAQVEAPYLHSTSESQVVSHKQIHAWVLTFLCEFLEFFYGHNHKKDIMSR